MAISMGSGEGAAPEAMSEINTTPLVDVMLVLLILFLITIPVITQSVKVDLPKAANIPTQTKPENINIAVDAEGNVFWNTAMVPNQDALLERIKQVAVMDPQPEIHLRPNKLAEYKDVASVMASAQRLGLVKLGLVGNEQFVK